MKSLPILPIDQPVTASVTIPGSKSYTNRALLMAAMTPTTVLIEHPLISDDTEAMIACLTALGIAIERQGDSIAVPGHVNAIEDTAYELDVNLSGITMRFLLALACVIPGTQTLYGKEGLNKRPIGELVDGLRQAGARINYLENEGFPPVQVTSSTLRPGTIKLNGSISSQYFSALFMVAPLVGDLTIQVVGKQISKPYIDMTIDTMTQFGITVHNDKYKTYLIHGNQRYQAKRYTVEGDVSSASYFYAIAALTKSTLTTHNINPASKQADMHFLHFLERMGNEVLYGNNQITLKGTDIKPVNIDMQDCPDQAMTMAVLATFAPGTSTIRGIQSLRVKETERVVAVEQELAKMSIRTESTHDTLTIYGGKPKPAAIDTYGDHRMAMSFAVAGTKLPGIVINDPGVVGKTFPEFWKVLAALTATNIVLIGMRGSGKNTIGEVLAAQLGKSFVDLDAIIVEYAKQTIPAMVEQHGWEYFRDQESAAAVQAGTRRNCIIATGGGAVLRRQNVMAFKQHGTLVLLTAKQTTLAKRIKGDTNRPPLTTKNTLLEELQDVWDDRQNIYHEVADIVIQTDDKTPQTIAKTIIQKLSKLQS